MAKASLTIAIGGEYQGKDAIKKAEAELRSLREAARQAGGSSSEIMKLGDSMVDLGSNMEVAGQKTVDFGSKLTKMTAPLAAVGAASVKLASDYENSVAKVFTIMDKQAMGTGQMSQNILDLSTATGKSATELAEASYQALSASVETSKVGGFVEQSVKLAKAGFTETSTAVDTLTTVINAYGYSADDAAMISERLVQTQNKGKTTVAELASSMGSVIPTASAYNVSLDNLCSGYVLLTKQGIDTANATTALNGMMTELADSGSQVGKVLKSQTGRTFGELMQEGQTLGDVIQVLSDSVGGNSEAFANLWGNVRAAKGALAIANAGASEFEAAMQDMANSTGLVDSALEDLQTPAAKAQKAINALKNTGIELGEEMLGAAGPAIDDLASKAQALYKWFSELPDGTKQAIVTVGALAVAAGPVAALFGKGSMAIGGFVTKVGQGVQTIGTFSAAMKKAEADMAAAGTSSASLGTKIKAAAEATGLASKATTMLKGALATIGTVGVVEVVSIIVQKYTEWAEHTDMVTKATQDLVGVFQETEAAMTGSSDAAQKAAGGMAESGGAIQDALRAMGDLNEQTRSSVGEMKAAEAQVDHYASVIGDLAEKGSLTKEEQVRLADAVGNFNQITGATISVVDQQTGALSMSKAQILESAEAWKRYAEAKAYADIYSKYTQKMIEDSIALEEATRDLEEAEKGFGIWIGDFPVYADEASVKYHDLEKGVQDLSTAQESAARTAEEAMNRMKEGAGAANPFASSMKQLGSSMDQAAQSMSKTEDASRSLEKQLDAQYKAQQKAFDNAYKAQQKAFDNEYKAQQKAMQAEEAALQKSNQKCLKEAQKSFDAEYDALQKSLDARYDAMKKGFDKEEDELAKSNQRRLDEMKSSQDETVKAFEKATDERIAAMDREYKASVRLAEDSRDARMKAIDGQIAALQAQDEAAEAAARETERAQKKAELQKAVNSAKSSTARARAEKALADYMAQIAEEDAKERRKKAIEELEAKKQDIRDETDAEMQALQERYTARKELYSQQRAEQLEAIKVGNELEYAAYKEKLDAQETALKESHARTLQAQKDADAMQLEAMKADQELQMEAMREAQQAQEEAMREAHQMSLDGLKESQQAQLEAMRESQQAQLESLKESQQAQLEALQNGRTEQNAVGRGTADDMKRNFDMAAENAKTALELAVNPIGYAARQIRSAVGEESDGAAEDMGEAGSLGGMNFALAIQDMAFKAQQAASEMGEGASDELESAADGSYEAGREFSRGFSDGTGSVDVYTAAWNVGLDALSAIKSALGIASPSKEAMWVGEMYGKGVAIGMGKAEGEIEAESRRLTDAMTLEPTPYGTYAVPGGYQRQQEPNEQAMRQFVINMTINVTARSEEEAVLLGQSYGESLYQELARRERQL